MTSPPVRYFATELRHAREQAGLTQSQLAKEINYARPTVTMVETAQRVPTLDFAKLVDETLGTDGRFSRMVNELLLSVEVTPDWFQPWADLEREATEIRWYEPLLVPGLLQTTAYARALLDDEDKVAARVARQDVLEQASVYVIIEEGVLHRHIGDCPTMQQQLMLLTSMELAVVQVLPCDTDTRLGVDGSFALAVLDGREVAYVDTPARGFVLDERGVVSHVRQRWERLAAEALPRQQSRKLIAEVAETWTQQ